MAIDKLHNRVHCKNSKNLTRSRQGTKKIKIYDEKANLSLKHFKKSKKNTKILAAKSPEWGLRLCVEKYLFAAVNVPSPAPAGAF